MNIWLGFTDQICKVANLRDPFTQVVNSKTIDAILGWNPNDHVVHTVGRWWNSNDGIELRNQLKDAGFHFQHHLISNK